MQDLWQVLYQMLLMIFLKEFLELNVNLDKMIKKCETCRIKYKYYNCFLEYTSFKDDLKEYKYLCSNKSYQRKFNEKLKEWFFNT